MYMNNQSNMFFNVNGYEGALQFSCLPNQTVLLLDTQNPYLYMKQANQMGQATIKTFLLKEMENNPDRQREIDLFESFDKRLKAIEERLGNVQPIN